jgi:hypothetical protein
MVFHLDFGGVIAQGVYLVLLTADAGRKFSWHENRTAEADLVLVAMGAGCRNAGLKSCYRKGLSEKSNFGHNVLNLRELVVHAMFLATCAVWVSGVALRLHNLFLKAAPDHSISSHRQ